MGYAKYYEDNIEIANKNSFDLFGPPFGLKEEKKKYFICNFCGKRFEEKESLNSHIKHFHDSFPIVLVNDKVVTMEKNFSAYDVVTASIQLNGYYHPVFVDGQKLSISGVNKDITSIVRDSFYKNDKCCIEVGDYRINISRFCYKAIDHKKLIGIIEDWSTKTMLHVQISKADEREFNEDENSILSGFYNYFIACNAKSSDKTNRYDDAFEYLSRFCFLKSPILPLIACALRIIAFKRNWINKLKAYCIVDDQFSTAVDFFTNSKDKTQLLESGKEKGQLYIEDDIQENIDAINNYMQRNLRAVDSYLEKYTSIETVEDSNLKDRILLLKAKLYRDKGNIKKARRLMEDIKTESFKLA